MIYGFELSGEDEHLPEAEITALFETYRVAINKKMRFNRLLLLEVSEEVEAELIGEITDRIALSHVVIEVYGITDANMDDIEKIASKVSSLISGSYAVSAKIWDNSNFTSLELERSLGSMINRESLWVDLKRPDTKIRLYIIGRTCIIGKIIHIRRKKEFNERLPHNRPFFSPGVLKPKIARALVNLSRIKPPERILDPFAGTGGVLLEAGLMGISVLGIDIQERMIRGAKKNLKELNCASLLIADSGFLPFKDGYFDGIVKSLDSLYRCALSEIFRVLKSGRFAALISDRDVKNLIKEAGFEIINEYKMRIHRSMTRRIYIMQKKVSNAF
jgi:tRNA (guanine10-N2)-dimethyltransferase